MTSAAPGVASDKKALSRADAILLAICAAFAVSMLDGLFKESLYRLSPLAFGVFDFAKFVILPMVLLAWLYSRLAIRPSMYGVRRFDKGDHWLRTVVMIALLTLVLYAAYYFSSRLAWMFTWRVSTAATFYYAHTVPEGWLHYPVAIYYGLTAGLVEEIFFRGLPLLYLQERFGKSYSRAAYVGGTALAFGLIHWENGLHEIIATAVFGAIAAGVYLQLRNLWPLIAAHALADIWEFT